MCSEARMLAIALYLPTDMSAVNIPMLVSQIPDYNYSFNRPSPMLKLLFRQEFFVALLFASTETLKLKYTECLKLV